MSVFFIRRMKQSTAVIESRQLIYINIQTTEITACKELPLSL